MKSDIRTAGLVGDQQYWSPSSISQTILLALVSVSGSHVYMHTIGNYVQCLMGSLVICIIPLSNNSVLPLFTPTSVHPQQKTYLLVYNCSVKVLLSFMYLECFCYFLCGIF